MSSDKETFEEYLKKILPKETETFIYEREHPFLSNERLNNTFGNIAFFQFAGDKDLASKNTFSVLFSADCNNEDKAKEILSNYTGNSRPALLLNAYLIRFGYLKCFFSERFNPFQETMKRILELKEIKSWIADALDKRKMHHEISLTFANGEPIAIFSSKSIIYL